MRGGSPDHGTDRHRGDHLSPPRQEHGGRGRGAGLRRLCWADGRPRFAFVRTPGPKGFPWHTGREQEDLVLFRPHFREGGAATLPPDIE
jgi:hypothetical protein